MSAFAVVFLLLAPACGTTGGGSAASSTFCNALLELVVQPASAALDEDVEEMGDEEAKALVEDLVASRPGELERDVELFVSVSNAAMAGAQPGSEELSLETFDDFMASVDVLNRWGAKNCDPPGAVWACLYRNSFEQVGEAIGDDSSAGMTGGDPDPESVAAGWADGELSVELARNDEKVLYGWLDEDGLVVRSRLVRLGRDGTWSDTVSSACDRSELDSAAVDSFESVGGAIEGDSGDDLGDYDVIERGPEQRFPFDTTPPDTEIAVPPHDPISPYDEACAVLSPLVLEPAAAEFRGEDAGLHPEWDYLLSQFIILDVYGYMDAVTMRNILHEGGLEDRSSNASRLEFAVRALAAWGTEKCRPAEPALSCFELSGDVSTPSDPARRALATTPEQGAALDSGPHGTELQELAVHPDGRVLFGWVDQNGLVLRTTEVADQHDGTWVPVWALTCPYV